MTQAPVNPQQIAALSDEQLWAIVNKQETLLSNDQTDLESSIDAYDQYVELRSQALVIFKQRGYEIEKWLKSTA